MIVDATPSAGAAPDHPSQLGPFVIESVAGRGAFGTVYRATDTRNQRSVALKVLHRSNLSPFTIRRLQAEEEALRSLEDDNFSWFPRVVEAGRCDGVPYLAMDYVAGGRIDAFCDARRLEVPGRVALFRLVCLAMQRAHQHGILHLDLKPAHILVHDDADPKGDPAPRIIDLGLAQGVDRALVLDESSYGAPLGTPGFMSPELLAGKKGDARSDVYALGVVLYWLLSGCRPKDAIDTSVPGLSPAHRPDEMLPRPEVRWREVLRNDPALAAQLAERRGESPASMAKVLASDLGTIVMRAIAPDPRRRYQDPGELAADLQRFLEHRPIPGRRERLYRARLFVRRNRAVVGVVTSAITAMVTLLVLLASNLAQAKEHVRLVTSEQRAIATSLVRSGQMAAQRGRWREAIALYTQAEQTQLADPLELGILQVQACAACSQTDQAQLLLDQLSTRPDAEKRRATLLLLQGDLGVTRFGQPEAGLDKVRAALALAETNREALTPVELEYAKSLLAATPREALECLRRARADDASHHRVNLSYAFTLLMLGDQAGLMAFAPVFQSLNPDDENANYVSILMVALGGNEDAIKTAIHTVHEKFGPEAADVAEAVVEVIEMLGWANSQMRSMITKNDAGLRSVVASYLNLWGKIDRLRRAFLARQEQFPAVARFAAIVPPSVGRCYEPLIRLVAMKPFRPQTVGAAFASLPVGQVDGGLLYFHALGLVFDGKLREALHRLEQALQTPSVWCERRTMLLFGCSLGAKAYDESPATEPSEVRDSIRTIVLGWVREAASRQDWNSREMSCIYETAMLLHDVELAVPIGHRWFSLAPDDYQIRIAHVEVLALEGALERADTLLRELEASLQEADSAARIRLADVRRLVDKLKKQ